MCVSMSSRVESGVCVSMSSRVESGVCLSSRVVCVCLYVF